jgi:hypothetical protein
MKRRLELERENQIRLKWTSIYGLPSREGRLPIAFVGKQAGWERRGSEESIRERGPYEKTAIVDGKRDKRIQDAARRREASERHHLKRERFFDANPGERDKVNQKERERIAQP